ncbi:MAG: fibro-slime domain-containing protein [Fibrobacter sp.]|nr:fibro-slime domain-containing protein [Fibrobacter sp.]
MLCRDFLKGAGRALALSVLFGAGSALAATYTGTVDYSGNLYYKVLTENGGQSQSCKSAASGISYTNTSVDTRRFQFFTDNKCQKKVLVEISGAELFPEGTTTALTIKADGSWELKAAPKPGEDPDKPAPVSSSSVAQSSSSSKKPGTTSSSSVKEPVKDGKKTIAFFTPWSNTNAVLFVDGDSVATMTAMDKYCGWFRASVTPPANGLKVYFKQTIGTHYVGAEGLVTEEPTIATEISLDSVAALSDTIWVQGYKNDVPAVFSKFPGVLGDCPLKKFPVTVFDWLHGNKGDGGSAGQNGDPANGVSSNFGSGGCNSVRGMVKYDLGKNGVPVPSDPFPEKCLRSDHLAEWFLPEVVGKDAKGVEYTNMTCRDLYISMDDEGFWLAEVSKDRISKGNEKNKGGMFLLDDFEYLDEAKTVKNPYFDWLNGSGGNHNFGFTVKIQAQFEYVPGQYFDFYGDDDVWVFIDNRLAVDIGGQHGQEAGAVLLDTIGQNNGKKLVPGETYDFHIFYVERHTSQSNFRMRTSIDLQVDASIFVDSDRRGDVTSYNVWQINKKNKLSCGYDPNNTEVDTTAGPSTFKLTGGNLAEPEILGVGTHYEGITIIDDHTFSIDSTKIVDNFTLAPGHYFLEITLKSDPSQSTKVEIVIPSYAIPSVAFAADDWKILGKEVSGDTLQIGDWAYATYKVNISFFEEWAQVTNYNKKINLSFTDPNIEILDSTGKKISYVNLDDKGRASFYIHANAVVTGATLIAKGAAAGASTWTNLNFRDPPIPHVKSAIIVDRNGDGRADSLFVSYDKELNGKSHLDSIQFTFGESFATTTKYKILENGTDLVITAENMDRTCDQKNCGFGSRQFTGANDDVYVGSLNSWFTYVENNKSTLFNTENEEISDGVGPIVLKATKKKLRDGNLELTVTLSEAITDESREEFANLFEIVCMRSGVSESPDKPVQASGSGNTIILIYSPSKQDAVLPNNGDLIRLLADDVITEDLSGNKPHKDNPMATITGDQDISNEAPGVIAVGEDPFGIIANKETTQPTLITDINQDAQSIGDSLGVQGHLIDLDISKIMFEETQKVINILDAIIESHLGSTTSYDTLITGITEEEALEQLFKDIEAGMVGEAYGISEETIAAVTEGTITKENFKSKLSKDEVEAITGLVKESVETSRDTVISVGEISSTTQADIIEAIRHGDFDDELKKAGISPSLIETIKNDLDENNIEEFRNGSKSLVSDSAVVMHYQTRYYSQFGEYVGGASKTIKCSDESVYGPGGCLENKGKLFLAWNMRADDGRVVGTGVYIARLQIKIMVNGKTTLDQTRDKLMGVRRGQLNGLKLEF